MSIKADRTGPIFMIGMPRSGTTVISEALSLHPELGWLSNYLGRFPGLPFLAFLDRLTNHPSWGWRFRGKKSQSKGIVSALKRFLPHTDEAYAIWERCCGHDFPRDYLLGQRATETASLCMHRYVGRVLNYQNRTRLFTKLTGPARICYLTSIFPDAVFIHTMRDPRAVISSLQQVYFWQEGGGRTEPWWRNGLTEEDLSIWHEYGKTAAALGAVQWKRVVELTWQEKGMLGPDRFTEVRYEDFVSSPHEVMDRLLAELGLADSPQIHNYLSTFGEIRNMNYKFPELLTSDEILTIERITSDTASRAGYSFLHDQTT